jgi:hypothetical protein
MRFPLYNTYGISYTLIIVLLGNKFGAPNSKKIHLFDTIEMTVQKNVGKLRV